MSADAPDGRDETDHQLFEAKLREDADLPSPREAVRERRDHSGVPRAVAVLREPAPVHRRPAPSGVELSAAVQDPLPAGTAIVGAVTSRQQVQSHVVDGVGWVVRASEHGREPVPVITGQYYDGTPRLAIIAELSVLPGDETGEFGKSTTVLEGEV